MGPVKGWTHHRAYPYYSSQSQVLCTVQSASAMMRCIAELERAREDVVPDSRQIQLYRVRHGKRSAH